MAKIAVAFGERLLLSIDEVAGLLGIGRDLVYRLVLDLQPGTQRPRLHSVMIGKRRMVSRRALERFIEQEDR
jgi:excisionase family DNA binding protein